jgi:outer membrane protein assembly factor BamE
MLARAALCALVAALVAGCQTIETYMPTVRNFGVYKIDINQGNYLTQDMVDRLKVGQTTQQVRLILGTPLLVDPFHDNRWDYTYMFMRQGRIVEHRNLTVFFADGKLARWEGDEMPKSMAELNRAAFDKSLGHVPSADDPGIFDWIINIFKR